MRNALAFRSAAIVLFAALAGCAGFDSPGSGGPAADAPTLRVGDRWVYRAADGFRVALQWSEMHVVTSVTPGAITVRITEAGPNARGERTEVWSAPGLLASGAVFDDETRRFSTPIKIYDFPLAPGERWNQWVDNLNAATNKTGQINRYVTVGGWEKVATPAGTFDAIKLRVLMRLDDEEFWRGPTQCNYLIYYSPAVGAMVRAEKNAEYWEKSDRRDGVGAITAQHAVLELESYSRGGT
ncbi:MAG TPA: hypothetical protein VEO36_13940 [Casimicrobiaceae bacterium]|nr:hypothetical protein [Casimicrobiaceae bacterium]